MSALAHPAPLLEASRVRPVLRDYQRRGVNEILACLQRGLNPLYCLPTAGGKGPVIGEVGDVISAQGWETWIFAHRAELIDQLSEHLSNVGVEHGIISPATPLTDHPTQVCSIDTVRSRIATLRHRLSRVRLVVIDECHHSAAGSYQLIKSLCPRAQFLGTTATAFRHDGKPLGNDFNAEVRGPSIRDLEEGGFISPIRLIAPPAKVDLSRVKRQMGDFVVSQLEAAVNTDEVTQAAILAYARHAGGLPTLVFCTGVAHAVDAATAFRAAGWSVEVMEATMSRCLDPRPGENRRQARRRCIRGLASGRYQLLFTIGMAGEGTDIPVCSGGLDLRPTQSTQLWLQHCGRVKRLYPGKAEAIWLDMVGNWSRHGMPNADRAWSLTGGLKGLERAVAAVRRCGKCHHVHERGPERCPSCNRKYPVTVVRAGAPSETQIAAMPGLGPFSAPRIAAMSLRDLLPLARTRPELETIAAIRGYKRGWVDHVLRERGSGMRRWS